MKYTELQAIIGEERDKFPMKFAFNEDQLQEGLKELGVTKAEVVSIGAGGFIRKTDKADFIAMFDSSQARLKEAFTDDAFMVDALIYELGNHEYCITMDDSDALGALGLDESDPQVSRCLKEAKRLYNEWQEING